MEVSNDYQRELLCAYCVWAFDVPSSHIITYETEATRGSVHDPVNMWHQELPIRDTLYKVKRKVDAGHVLQINAIVVGLYAVTMCGGIAVCHGHVGIAFDTLLRRR